MSSPGGDAPLLDVVDVDFSYGPLQVLFGASLRVERGARVGLLGTNGAGKSTILKVVSGLVSPASGKVLYDGEDITGVPPDRRVRLGLVQVPGGKATFPTLTVRENLVMGAYSFLDQKELVAQRLGEVYELFPALHARQAQAAGTLSGGEQQMMALGRALVTGPSLLMIDELSLGLAPVVMQQVVEAVEEIARRGVTLLLVEQSLNIALSLVEYAYFMEKGEVRYSGSADDLLERGDLVRSVFFGDTAPGG